MHRRTLAAAAALAAAAGTTVPLLASPASAAVADPGATRSLLVTAVDTDGDVDHGLYVTDGSTRTALVPESATTDVYAVSTSRDGSRIAYLEDLYSTAGDLTGERLVVRDATVFGAPAFSRVVYTTSTDLLDAPRFSPDGASVVFTRVTDTGVSALTVPVASGAATLLADGVYGASYLDANTLIGTTETGVVTFPSTAGSTTTPVDGVTAADGLFAVSPDGTEVVWERDTSTTDSKTPSTDLHVGDLALASGKATVTGDRAVTSGGYSDGPVWSPDGTSIRYVSYDAGFLGSLRSVPAAGGASSAVAASGDHEAVAYATAEATAPGAVTVGPAVLAGTSPTVSWTLPSDADLYGVEITRSGYGATRTVRVAAPATSYKDSGLVLGKTYTYSVAALDKAGDRGTATTRQVTALAATATFTDPTSTASTTAAFRVGFPAGSSYTVQYRTNGTGPLTTWLTRATGTSQVFSAAKPGSSYGFLVTVYDAYGNSSAATGAGTAVVPLDQTAATFAGSVVKQSLSGRYLGSAELLKAAGASARLTVKGNRLQVVGERCSSCGVMDVYVDGARVAGVDTRAAARQARVVLYTRTLSTSVSHTVVVKARGTAGRPTVVLDGFGVRH